MIAQWRIDFQRRGKVETFPWARVQPMGNGIQLTLDIARQVRALGQVLARQPIRMLVDAPLPGALRVTKVVTTGVLAALLVGVAIKLKLMGGAQ